MRERVIDLQRCHAPGIIGPLAEPRQRRVRRVKVRHEPPADEPQVRRPRSATLFSQVVGPHFESLCRKP
jgi:hypothetical protein